MHPFFYFFLYIFIIYFLTYWFFFNELPFTFSNSGATASSACFFNRQRCSSFCLCNLWSFTYNTAIQTAPIPITPINPFQPRSTPSKNKYHNSKAYHPRQGNSNKFLHIFLWFYYFYYKDSLLFWNGKWHNRLLVWDGVVSVWILNCGISIV